MIFAEALLRDLGQEKFQAFSAGSRPNTQLNTFALEVLKRNGHDIGDLRSKTSGRAVYSMEFDSYSEVPRNVADEIVQKTAGE